MDRRVDQREEVEFIRGVLRAEAGAVSSISESMGEEASAAVELMAGCVSRGGSVLVTGLGKSGLIGKKISATLASLGAPSHDIHPSEAAHGDLGRIRRDDCLIALSRSGETDEVVSLVEILRPDGVPIISITAGAADGGKPRNTLARLATVALSIGSGREASEELLAPTCSTTATMALGDALALALARRLRFTTDDFARRHPGGTLGGLLRPVVDVLRFKAGKNLPVVGERVTVRAALEEAAAIGRRPGALLVVDGAGLLRGIFTDGDVRRLVLSDPGGLDRAIGEVMTRSPRTLSSGSLVRDAVRMVRENRQDEIPVVDDSGRPVGLLDVQDLVAIKVVED
ncbi:MAG: KpsF/GutQ family sugar-phosphate isomerase [Phycisphaerae bacterium]|nr:KpsF/GutQ family sugar-phosphate isomerase [Phycisphaerae bacterium]